MVRNLYWWCGGVSDGLDHVLMMRNMYWWWGSYWWWKTVTDGEKQLLMVRDSYWWWVTVNVGKKHVLMVGKSYWWPGTFPDGEEHFQMVRNIYWWWGCYWCEEQLLPSEHMMSKWHRTGVDATSIRRINISTTLVRRHLPPGWWRETVTDYEEQLLKAALSLHML